MVEVKWRCIGLWEGGVGLGGHTGEQERPGHVETFQLCA